MKLPREFYLRRNVVLIAKELLGKVVVTKLNGQITSGIITETEAYEGVTDKASHAFGGRRTKRTEVMFGMGGIAYVYLCYGIHHLFNVVTNQNEVPHAVLIRSIKPVDGLPMILKRRKKENADKKLCIGPGSVSQALGICTSHTGIDLIGNKIWIEDRSINISSRNIIKSPRIGIDYAGAHALLPYRFVATL